MSNFIAHTGKIGLMLLFLSGAFGGAVTKAQDGTFSQYYTNPIFLNPAFVGSAEGMRISMGHRIQWPYIPGQFSTTGIGVGYQPDR